MHNIHYLRIYASSPEEACENALCEIEDFGNENNWRHAIGAVCEDGTIYYHSTEDEETLSDNVTFETLEAEIVTEMENSIYLGSYYREAFNRCISETVKFPFDWYIAEKYCHHKYEVESIKSVFMERKENPKFDIRKDTFKEWELNEIGLTDLTYGNSPSEEEKMYIVLINMHS